MTETHKEYEIIRSEGLKGLRFLVNQIGSRTSHLHKELELCWVLRGTGVIAGGGFSIELQAGELILIEANEAHEINGGPDGVLLAILQVSKTVLSAVCPGIRSVRFCTAGLTPFFSEEEAMGLRKKLLRAFCAYYDGGRGYELACMAEVYRIFHTLLERLPLTEISDERMRADLRAQARLGRILQYIEEHSDEPMTLTELAESEGLSATYFSHFFRKHLHIGFYDYLSRLRFEKALRLYADTELSLTELCLESGFPDTRYFSRVFSQQFGHRPHRQPKDRGLLQRPARGEGRQGSVLEHIYSPEDSRAILKALEAALSETERI